MGDSTEEEAVLADSEIISLIFRHMAWERAKGELRSMSQTFVGETDEFTALDRHIENFIKSVEENHL